jgi:hypothetical protein
MSPAKRRIDANHQHPILQRERRRSLKPGSKNIWLDPGTQSLQDCLPDLLCVHVAASTSQETRYLKACNLRLFLIHATFYRAGHEMRKMTSFFLYNNGTGTYSASEPFQHLLTANKAHNASGSSSGRAEGNGMVALIFRPVKAFAFSTSSFLVKKITDN